MLLICFQAVISPTVSPLSTLLHFAFPRHTQCTIDKEAVKIESDAGLLSERFTLRGGAVWSSHAWRETTGYREILCVQQYGLVTRTPLWLAWMTGWRSHLSLHAQWNVLLCGHLVSIYPIRSSDHHCGYNPTCVHDCSVRVIYIQCDRRVFILREWSLPYTLDSLWYIWWSTFPLCWQVHICTTGLIVTPPPSSPVTTATVFTFPSETSYTSIPVVGGILYRSFKSYKR